MARQTIRRTARVAFDILLFALVWFGEFAIHKWFVPFRRGFFCDDESLSYPFRESRVSLFALAIISFTVAPLVMLSVELFKHIEPSNGNFNGHAIGKRKSTSSSASASASAAAVAAATNGAGGSGGKASLMSSSSSSTTGYRLGYRLLQCYKQIGYYLFGLGIILLATEIPKFAAGRLRPNFFTICQPQMPDGSTCNDAVNQGRYITDYTCVGHNFTASTVAQVNQSFPSGHASILFFAMLYLSMYLQAQLTTHASKLLKHVLQFIFMMFAVYVALTRVSDYWHHWSDVLSGVLLGSITAIVVALFMSDLFERRGLRFYGGAFRSQMHKLANSSGSAASTAKMTTSATTSATTLPAYTFGTLPYLHYAPHHHHPHAQYGHATYQNYGYIP